MVTGGNGPSMAHGPEHDGVAPQHNAAPQDAHVAQDEDRRRALRAALALGVFVLVVSLLLQHGMRLLQLAQDCDTVGQVACQLALDR